jgi:hypothetical protein
VSAAWEGFLARRERHLLELAGPVLVCQGRNDTPSPMFHGCFDWHSCVHAVWALYTIHQRTGADMLLDAAGQQARPELVPAELEHMRTAIPEENPYGFGWLLALVHKQEAVTGGRELRPLADHAAAQVGEWLRGLDTAAGRERALDDMHDNLSWTLCNAHLWALHAGDEQLLATVRAAAARHLEAPELDAQLPVAQDTEDPDEFMPTALLRLAALVQIRGAGAAGDYVRARLPEGFTVPRVAEPRGVHAAGANFFRAYALWDLFEATGDERFRDAYADLIEYHVSRPEYWRDGDNAEYRHWVAQIGVRAIDRSYGAAS